MEKAPQNNGLENVAAPVLFGCQTWKCMHTAMSHFRRFKTLESKQNREREGEKKFACEDDALLVPPFSIWMPIERITFAVNQRDSFRANICDQQEIRFSPAGMVRRGWNNACEQFAWSWNLNGFEFFDRKRFLIRSLRLTLPWRPKPNAQDDRTRTEI